MFFKHKQRDMSELQTDPYFPFFVGRLVGASEITSHWLQLQPGTDAKDMGARLGLVVGWFLTDQPDPLVSGETTKVIPPKTGTL